MPKILKSKLDEPQNQGRSPGERASSTERHSHSAKPTQAAKPLRKENLAKKENKKLLVCYTEVAQSKSVFPIYSKALIT